MRYLTATIGAVVVFFSVLVIGVVIFASLPPQLQNQDLTFHFGIFHARGNPVLLLTPILGFAGAFHSFRDSLKRYRIKVEKNRVPIKSIDAVNRTHYQIRSAMLSRCTTFPLSIKLACFA